MTDTPRHQHGSIEVELGGKTYTLRTTIEAADKIDREFGGVMQAIDRVRSLSLAAVSRIVIIGIGTTSKGGQETLRQAVFDAGIANVGPAAVQFLLALVNPGGTKVEDDGEIDEGNG